MSINTLQEGELREEEKNQLTYEIRPTSGGILNFKFDLPIQPSPLDQLNEKLHEVYVHQHHS